MSPLQRPSVGTVIKDRPSQWKLRKHACWLLVAGLLALGIIAREHPQSRPRPASSAESGVVSARPGSAAWRAPQVDPRIVRKLGAKTFQVIRTGAMREPGDARAFVLSRLEKSRRGDALATYEIYLAVLDCRAVGSPAELQNLDAMRTASPDAGALARIEKRLEECGALLTDADLMAGRWLERAAEQGSVEAMLMYVVDTESIIGGRADFIREPERVVEWRRNALSYLKHAASLGSVDALLTLARVNEQGVIVKADPVEAYAYYLAAGQVSLSFAPTELLAPYASELSAEQVRLARLRSTQIHEACCRP